IGAATRFRNSVRIAAFCFSMPTTFCSSGEWGWPLFAISCSQLELWYFWTTLLATWSSIGNCCAYTTPASAAAATAVNDHAFLLIASPLWFVRGSLLRRNSSGAGCHHKPIRAHGCYAHTRALRVRPRSIQQSVRCDNDLGADGAEMWAVSVRSDQSRA